MLFRKKKKQDELRGSFGKLKDERFLFSLIRRYHDGKDHSGVLQSISDKICADLDFDELFMFADRSTSVVGQQYLYDRMRTIEASGAKTLLREKLISKFFQDEGFRLKVQAKLTKLQKSEAYYLPTLFQEEYIKRPSWFSLLPFLLVATIVSFILMIFNPLMIFIALALVMVNMGIHYWNKRHLYQYSDSIPQLLKLNAIAKGFFRNSELQQLRPSLAKKLSEINKVRRSMSLFRTEAQMDGELQALVGWVFELVKAVFVFEPILLFNVLRKLDGKRKEMAAIFEFVGEVDMLISIASLRAGLHPYCLPDVVDDSKSLSAEEVYHPLIINCVKNDIQLNGRSVLLTGSNMSGKTSFIRTIGINTLTALTLNTCFAASFRLPRMRIYSAIRISDDLMNDRSYYFEEVLTIKEMMEKSRDEHPNLFLLDEIFKGTNTVERISAGKAVLSALNQSNNLVFVSTHDVELTDLLHEEYSLYHFSEKVDSGTIDFDYKLKKGKLTERNAIRILEINDYPDEVVQEAFAIAARLDREK